MRLELRRASRPPLDYLGRRHAVVRGRVRDAGRPLPNGTYRLYARGRRNFDAAQFGSGPTSPSRSTSPRARRRPSPPSLDDAAQRVALTVTPLAAAGAADPLVTIQRSEDGGATWDAGARRREGSPGPSARRHLLRLRGRHAATALAYRASCEASFAALQLGQRLGRRDRRPGAHRRRLEPQGAARPVARTCSAPRQRRPGVDASRRTRSTFRPVGRTYPVVV